MAQSQHIAYTNNGRIWELKSPVDGETWTIQNLSAITDVRPVFFPWCSLTSWVDPMDQHIAFSVAPDSIEEMRAPIGTEDWRAIELTAVPGAPAPVVGAALTSWTDPEFQHVAYVSLNGFCVMSAQIGFEYWSIDNLTELTGANPTPRTALTSWVDQYFQHVMYLAEDGHIHETYAQYPANENWVDGDLTHATGGPPPAPGSALTSWTDPNCPTTWSTSSLTETSKICTPKSGPQHGK